MSSKIDITMPTTLRPKLLNKTLESFTKNLFTDKKRHRFIFNVDPVGEKGCKPEDIIEIAHSYFDDVLYNVAEKPLFPKAFKWCWDNAESDYIFHMNEDWELLRPINIDDMISILLKNNNLACLRLLKMDVPTNLKFFRSKYTDKGGYLQAENRKVSFGTNPELIKAEFYKEARKYLLEDANPEKQFRPWQKEMFNNVTSKWDYGVYARPGDKMLIKDTGKNWMSRNKFRKAGGPGFVKWEEIK